MQYDFFKHPGLNKGALMPIAMNMHLLKFRYGEYLQKAGQVPRGMYLIKSGQCILGLTRVAYRDKNW